MMVKTVCVEWFCTHCGRRFGMNFRVDEVIPDEMTCIYCGRHHCRRVVGG